MKKPFLSPHIKHDSRFSKGLFDDEVVQSVMCVPLQSGGLTVGYFLALNKNGNNKFAEYDLRLFEKMAAITAPFLNSAQEIREYFNAPLPEIALVSKYESAGLLGKSQRFIELLRAIEAAARCDVRVLLEGQSGTGKELVARAIHKFSSRKEKRFVAIDCGAIPERCPAHCYRLSRKKQIQVRADWGGVAVAQWGYIRATNDVDLKVLVSDTEYVRTAKLVRSEFPKRARQNLPENPLIVSVTVEGVIVDFLLSIPGYDSESCFGPA